MSYSIALTGLEVHSPGPASQILPSTSGWPVVQPQFPLASLLLPSRTGPRLFLVHVSPSLEEDGELSDVQSTAPDCEEILDVDQELSAEQMYSDTVHGVRSFMGWSQTPEFDSASSSQDDNPLAGTRTQQTGKLSVKVPVDDWLCRKFEKLNVTVMEGYLPCSSETTSVNRDQFVKSPKILRWYDMFSDKKDFSSCNVQ